MVKTGKTSALWSRRARLSVDPQQQTCGGGGVMTRLTVGDGSRTATRGAGELAARRVSGAAFEALDENGDRQRGWTSDQQVLLRQFVGCSPGRTDAAGAGRKPGSAAAG